MRTQILLKRTRLASFEELRRKTSKNIEEPIDEVSESESVDTFTSSSGGEESKSLTKKTTSQRPSSISKMIRRRENSIK